MTVHTAPPSDGDQRGWVATWTTALIRPSFIFENRGNYGFENETLRECVFVSVGGEAVRVRLTNEFGDRPLVVGRAAIGARQTPFNAALVGAFTRGLTFSGQTSVTIPIGQDVLSDPVDVAILPHQCLAVDIFLPEATGPVGYNFATTTTSFVGQGDLAGDQSGIRFQRSESWYVLKDVEVYNPDTPGLVVAFCDSVSLTGQWDANMRWPEILSRRLRAEHADAAPSVIQSTLSGQRLLTSFHFALSIIERFEREILTKTGLKTVILNVGVNDLGVAMMPPVDMYLPNTDVSSDDMIEGFKTVVGMARRAGIAIFGATITPGSGFRHQGNPYWSPGQEIKRRTINAWLRETTIFDGVFDFAVAVQNPLDPEYFAAWASADNIHPSDGGQYAIAQTVDLDVLMRAHCRADRVAHL